MLDLGCSVLPYPQYQPNQAILYLFWSPENTLNDKILSKDNQVKIFAKNFLWLRPAEFYMRGVYNLLGIWQVEIWNNEEYTINRK